MTIMKPVGERWTKEELQGHIFEVSQGLFQALKCASLREVDENVRNFKGELDELSKNTEYGTKILFVHLWANDYLVKVKPEKQFVFKLFGKYVAKTRDSGRKDLINKREGYVSWQTHFTQSEIDADPELKKLEPFKEEI